MGTDVRIGRVYDPPGEDEGERILVDRLWPRGLRRDDPRTGEWLPEAAPSSELRRWYGHEPSRFEEFSRRYTAELTEGPSADAVAGLRARARQGAVTLVTASRDLEASHVPTLARVMRRVE